MESPELARYIPQKSMKRVFPGSSSSCMDPEVVEISPPIHWSSKSKSLKQKEVIYHEVINIDMDDNSDSVALIDEDVDSSNKGKQLADDMEVADHDFLYGDDFMDLYDDVTYDDEYAFLQAQFDSMDIPPGVEAPIPWFSAPALNKKEVTAVNSSNHPSSMGQLDASGIDLSHSGGLPELVQPGKNRTSLSCSSSQTQVGTRQLYGTELSSFWLFPESSSNKKKSAGSTSSDHMSSHVGTGACSFSSRLKPWYTPGYSRNKRKPSDSGSAGDYTSHNHLRSVELTSGMHPSSKRSFLSKYQKKFGREYLNYSTSSATGTANLPAGVNPLMSGGKGSLALPNQSSFMSDVMFQESSDAVHLFPEKEMDVHGIQNTAKSSTVPTGSMSSIKNHVNRDDIMKKFQLFKQFDTVEEHSDHHYASKGSSVKRPSKNWAKRIQEEWRILEKDLPDTIFVRVYESRMDLLRAVIVGAEETPYHDGLFFFDVFFPCGYPNVPPHVYYHSGGLRINPNLYNCGKVCLSLLNTWSGSQNEKWIPGLSTMLQVLVSIQALILNEKPYFNEPGYARMGGTASGEKNSEQYNEKTFILSLKTMVYTMRRPPKHFEDFVFGHFCNRAQDILVACKAYMDGAQVGCLAKGGVQDVDAGDKSCSLSFKGTLASHITMLVEAFIQIGAKDCEKFLPLAKKGNGLVKSGLVPALFT